MSIDRGREIQWGGRRRHAGRADTGSAQFGSVARERSGKCRVSGGESGSVKIIPDESADRQIVGRLRGDEHAIPYVAEPDLGVDAGWIKGVQIWNTRRRSSQLRISLPPGKTAL